MHMCTRTDNIFTVMDGICATKTPKRNEESDPNLSKVTRKICLGNYKQA